MNFRNFTFIVTAVICFMTSCTKQAEPMDDSYLSEASDYGCLADSAWFVTDPVTGLRKTPPPEEGSNSVFADNATVTNCDFHQWSWQKFLWLTNEEDGQPLFLKNLLQINANGFPPKGKPENAIVLTSIAQASGSTDILKTNSKTNDTVYYGIFIDSSLYQTITEYAPTALDTTQSIAEVTYPIGALELKTSWVKKEALQDTSAYFITTGLINGQSARVALLGMHVIGIVENHPEFVWATFEHDNLAPAYNWALDGDTVISNQSYPLYDSGAVATVKNITTGNGIYTDVFSVYPFGVPLTGTQPDSAFMKTSQEEPKNFNNIDTINSSVKSQLTGVWNNYYYNGSIWIDTEGYEGTTAQAKLLDSLGYNLSSSQPGDLTRGSVSAYNITMETYVQVGFGPTGIRGQSVSSLVNCFSCHNAKHTIKKAPDADNLSPLYLSHVFSGRVDSLSGLNATEVKQAHVEEIIRHFKLRAAE